mmetsp:Transcript_23554/g.26124  ORF Transcript_23554/g.26124 Transcript_23554/m.26124 type:complete len:115 (-) Transcript_23554:145-489(-)
MSGARLIAHLAMVLNKKVIPNIRGGKISNQQASMVADEVISFMRKSIMEEGCYRQSAFGSFLVRTRAPRMARNPKTGEAISVPEKNVVVFKPSASFKQMVLEAKPYVKASAKPE